MYKVRDFFRERGFSADGVVADLTDRVQLDDAFRQSMELLGGRLDILVNCAGMQKRMDSVDFSREDWDAVVALNLNAVFFLSQLAAREMENSTKANHQHCLYAQLFGRLSRTCLYGYKDGCDGTDPRANQ